MALADLPGKEWTTIWPRVCRRRTGKSRLLLIQLAGRRRIEAVAALLKAADDPTRRSAPRPSRRWAIPSDCRDLPILIARVAIPENAEEAKAAEQALRTACDRMPDREACAASSPRPAAGSPVPAKGTLLEILTAMGGPKALKAVGAAAKDANPELQEAASRLLGEWMSVDAAPVLLDLAKTAPDAKYETRALRGYIRLARQFSLPDDERAEMCRAALATAKRDAEKKLVLDVLQRYPSLDMLKLAVETAKIPALKNEAAAASLAIAEKIGGSADVQKLLTQMGQEPVKVEIIKAEYGAGDKRVDVTAILRKHVRDFPLIVLPSSNYNSAFGGDPAAGSRQATEDPVPDQRQSRAKPRSRRTPRSCCPCQNRPSADPIAERVWHCLRASSATRLPKEVAPHQEAT